MKDNIRNKEYRFRANKEESDMRQELQKITEMLEVYADIEKSSRNYYWLENQYPVIFNSILFA